MGPKKKQKEKTTTGKTAASKTAKPAIPPPVRPIVVESSPTETSPSIPAETVDVDDIDEVVDVSIDYSDLLSVAPSSQMRDEGDSDYVPAPSPASTKLTPAMPSDGNLNPYDVSDTCYNKDESEDELSDEDEAHNEDADEFEKSVRKMLRSAVSDSDTANKNAKKKKNTRGAQGDNGLSTVMWDRDQEMTAELVRTTIVMKIRYNKKIKRSTSRLARDIFWPVAKSMQLQYPGLRGLDLWRLRRRCEDKIRALRKEFKLWKEIPKVSGLATRGAACEMSKTEKINFLLKFRLWMGSEDTRRRWVTILNKLLDSGFSIPVTEPMEELEALLGEKRKAAARSAQDKQAEAYGGLEKAQKRSARVHRLEVSAAAVKDRLNSDKADKEAGTSKKARKKPVAPFSQAKLAKKAAIHPEQLADVAPVRPSPAKSVQPMAAPMSNRQAILAKIKPFLADYPSRKVRNAILEVAKLDLDAIDDLEEGKLCHKWVQKKAKGLFPFKEERMRPDSASSDVGSP